jgi:shikimate kinase
MKLVFLYGAPATGKLTVGRELAVLTGYKLHHNHMAVDTALALFDYDDPHLLQLCQEINLLVFNAADQAKLTGLIFTFAYGSSLDDPFLDEVIRRYQNNVYFVHLVCEVDELKRRVVSTERQRYRKVRDPNILLHALARIDYAKDISHPHHMTVDTTHMPPRDAARRIMEQHNL